MKTRYDELIARVRTAAVPKRAAPAELNGYTARSRRTQSAGKSGRRSNATGAPPIDERRRATLGFVEKLTLRPHELTRTDAEAVRAAGVSDEALIDAVHLAALFNMIVRLADSLGWDVPTFEEFGARADAMLSSGYALPPEAPGTS
jgi:alkylhydroperoxidase family enzyme